MRVRCAPNAVNFAKRPLAGIYEKLTKLRDNFVIAMCDFACASNNFIMPNKRVRLANKQKIKAPKICKPRAAALKISTFRTALAREKCEGKARSLI